jgi:hypothetical protein
MSVRVGVRNGHVLAKNWQNRAGNRAKRACIFTDKGMGKKCKLFIMRDLSCYVGRENADFA